MDVKKGRRRLISGLTVAVSAGLVAAWISRPDHHAGPCVLAGGPVSLPEVREASGLAVSRRNPGVLWSHNDSANAAVLFALDGAMLDLAGEGRLWQRGGSFLSLRCNLPQ